MSSFSFQGHTYEIIDSALTWQEASAEAQRRGGYLSVVSTAAENLAICENAVRLLGRAPSAPDGGGSRYVWLGGSDAAAEGEWRWNDGSFLAGRYQNWGQGRWGDEPDDDGGQDALAMGLERWPNGTGGLGDAGQWNDLSLSNRLYFVVEYGASDNPRVELGTFYASFTIRALSPELSALCLTGATAIGGYGNALDNTLIGNTGGNRLYGLDGNDVLDGGFGADRLEGGAGDDELSGGADNDRLYGGDGRDWLEGGAGSDRFCFDASARNDADTVLDFTSGADRLCLSRKAFGPIKTRALASSWNAVGTKTRLILDADSETLYFDADGSGAAAAVPIVVLVGVGDLQPHDVQMY